MTSGSRRISGFGARIFIVLMIVSLVGVVTVAAAAVIGTSRGLSSEQEQAQKLAADKTAEAAASAYAAALGWAEADLTEAAAIASSAEAALVIQDAEGKTVDRTGRNAGQGRGPGGNGAGTGAGTGTGSGSNPASSAHASHQISTDVISGGAVVGRAILTFSSAATNTARDVAWSWILVGAITAIAVASVIAVIAIRSVTRPLRGLTQAARQVAAGDYSPDIPRGGVGELGELGEAFAHATDAVRYARANQRQMAADVAHELRTPLAALQAELEELSDGYAPATTETLARVHGQALRLGRVVDDLAALTNDHPTDFVVHKTQIDIAELFAELTELFEPTFAARKMTLKCTVFGSVTAHADRDRLTQVLGNLLNNSAKYARPGDSVTLTARVDDAHHIQIVAEDTGPGIAPEDLPHVTERFWRGSHETTGSGIGLSLADRLVKAQGGTLVIESDGLSGTRAIVTLPGSSSAASRAAL